LYIASRVIESFCRSFSGGRFPNKAEVEEKQRDVAEFLSSLLQHIDNCILRCYPSSLTSSISHPLRGELVHRIYALSQPDEAPPALIQRKERFFYISLNVMGFTDLTQSLADFVKEDVFPLRWPPSEGDTHTHRSIHRLFLPPPPSLSPISLSSEDRVAVVGEEDLVHRPAATPSLPFEEVPLRRISNAQDESAQSLLLPAAS
jgi:hypothetical protein